MSSWGPRWQGSGNIVVEVKGVALSVDTKKSLEIARERHGGAYMTFTAVCLSR